MCSHREAPGKKRDLYLFVYLWSYIGLAENLGKMSTNPTSKYSQVDNDSQYAILNVADMHKWICFSLSLHSLTFSFVYWRHLKFEPISLSLSLSFLALFHPLFKPPNSTVEVPKGQPWWHISFGNSRRCIASLLQQWNKSNTESENLSIHSGLPRMCFHSLLIQHWKIIPPHLARPSENK